MSKKSKYIPEIESSDSSILAHFQGNIEGLKRFVSRILRNKNDVDDVVQEVFLRAYSAEINKEIEQPRAYLFKVAKNVAINQLRQKTRQPTDYLEDYELTDVLVSDWTMEDELMAQQKLEIHCAAVATLPPKCRKVYLMRKVYGMSIKEISKVLGVSVSTVETHITRGFAQCDAYVEKRRIREESRSLTRKRRF